MRNSRNSNRKMWIIIVIAFCIVLAAGIGIGIVFSDMKSGKTQNADIKDKGQGHSSSAKNDTVQKDDKTSGTDKDNNNNGNTDKNSGNNNGSNSGSTNSNQNNGTQSNSQGDTGSTYDASAPADSTAIHRYEYILSDCTWQEAFQDCIKRGGYLVRINTPEEYDYIRKGITKQNMVDINFRIGGRRDARSKDYYWVNQNNKLFGDKLNADSSWCSDEWMKNEPSFQDGNLKELYMDLFFSNAEKRFVWNDVPNDMLQADPSYAGKLGYICEYDN